MQIYIGLPSPFGQTQLAVKAAGILGVICPTWTLFIPFVAAPLTQAHTQLPPVRVAWRTPRLRAFDDAQHFCRNGGN